MEALQTNEESSNEGTEITETRAVAGVEQPPDASTDESPTPGPVFTSEQVFRLAAETGAQLGAQEDDEYGHRRSKRGKVQEAAKDTDHTIRTPPTQSPRAGGSAGSSGRKSSQRRKAKKVKRWSAPSGGALAVETGAGQTIFDDTPVLQTTLPPIGSPQMGWPPTESPQISGRETGDLQIEPLQPESLQMASGQDLFRSIAPTDRSRYLPESPIIGSSGHPMMLRTIRNSTIVGPNLVAPIARRPTLRNDGLEVGVSPHTALGPAHRFSLEREAPAGNIFANASTAETNVISAISARNALNEEYSDVGREVLANTSFDIAGTMGSVTPSRSNPLFDYIPELAATTPIRTPDILPPGYVQIDPYAVTLRATLGLVRLI